MLKDLIKERLDAAAEEIFGLFERTIKSYEEQLYRVREESERHRQQLEAICKAQIVIRVGDVQQSIGHQENLPTQLLWGNSSLEQENPQPLTVKEEKDGQQLPHVKEEEEKADVSELSLPGVSKDSENNEDKLTNLLQLHHHHHDSSRGDLHGGLPPDNLQAPLTDSDCMEEPLGKDADCEAVLRELLTKQEMILDQQKRILGSLQKYHHPNKGSNEGTIPKGKIPVETVEALKRLEAELHTDPGLKSNLISYLGLIGGFNLKDTVWRIMKTTISNHVAKQMNWRGINNKISFQHLLLKTIIIEAVRRNPTTATASNKDVEVLMVKFLHLAGDREGGRRQRQQNAVEKKAEADG
ncbi:uncharacterized protein LOC130913494 isoform X1 [Corythoichthys intestinalis]|uniref:uncharacterized protein LOC130913494 isoform X1 n=1 Tax=Corythoichthys intestinalis TaxID=161448 RepID=UPI0025A58BE7|nr:uncharacterized protein LOC130913494 isoform X1 [Corythoichthys intestinalis]